MGRTWTMEDFDPKKDPMLDCSSVEPEATEDYDPAADEDNVEGDESD